MIGMAGWVSQLERSIASPESKVGGLAAALSGRVITGPTSLYQASQAKGGIDKAARCKLPHDLDSFSALHIPSSAQQLTTTSQSCCRQQFDRRPQRQTTRPWQSISHRRRNPSPTESQFYTTISPAQRRQSHVHNAAAWPSFPRIPLRHQTTQMMEKLPRS